MIECLIGPIASGKSTYVKTKDPSWIIVNDDAIVMSIHGEYKRYTDKLKFLYKTIEQAIITHGVQNGFNIVIDRPNLNIFTRKRYIGIAKSLDIKIKGVVFPFLSEQIHVDRRMLDPRGLLRHHWENAFKRQLESYTPPEMSEGFDDLVYVNI